MPTMQDVRARFPQYNDMSDAALADALHRKFYADMPRADFEAKIGLGAQAEAATPAPAAPPPVTPEPIVPPTQNSGVSVPPAPGVRQDPSGQQYDASGIPIGGVSLPAMASTPTQPPADAKFGGVAMNTTAGINEGIYATLGAPVDATRYLINKGLQGAEAITGADLPEVPEAAFGGSRFIAEQLGGLAPELDPRNTVATTGGERIARSTGQGIGSTIAPAGAVGILARTGALPGSLASLGQRTFGSTRSIGAVGGDLVAGAAGGAGAGAAVEATPDAYKPLAALGGGLAGGFAGALAAQGPRVISTGAGMVRDFSAPLTPGGRERLAVERVRGAASDPGALRGNIEEAPAVVPGSEPTTFQATGDMGLGALERAAQTRNPVPFQERRATQNAARRDALETVGGSGAPEAVSRSVRDYVGGFERTADEAIETARTAARDRAMAVGRGENAETVGMGMRESIEAARAQAKDAERALWSAVDPDGSLVVPSNRSRSAAQNIVRSRAQSAKPFEGETAAILDQLGRYGDAVPFSELGALRSRVSDALRAERRTNGETQDYRTLAMIRGSIEADLNAGIASQEARDQAAVAAGTMAPGETITARMANAPTTGNAVFTPSGRSVGVDYRVVDASILQTSQGPDGQPNPRYPAELQPRDRTRAASDAQIASISRNLQPERLGASTDAGTGAPIIGPDGIVESGNGRVAAIRRAYTEGGNSAQAYRDYLTAQGYDTTGIQSPVLVRYRTTELAGPDRVRFAQEANAGTGLSMSAGEQAATDASRLTPETLRLYRGGDPSSAENRDFVRSFLGSVADRGQEGSFVTGNGGLSLDGAQRVRSALLHSAYEDQRLVSALVDEGDANIQAFGRSLDDLAGEVSRLKARIRSGEVDRRADLSAPLVEAAKVVQGARSRGVRVSDAIAQQDAFSQVSPAAVEVLRFAYGPQLTGRLSRERLSTIMRAVIGEAEQQTADARLFGDALTIEQILEGARRRYGDATGSSVSSEPVGAGRDASRAGVGGSGSVPTGAGMPGGSADAPRGASPIGGESVLGREPNFDGTARDRLRAATDATRERAQRFDNRTMAAIRRRPSTTAPYDMAAARVPGSIFTSRPGSADTIRQFRAAVGDEQALPALEAYAVGKLREAAMREDGTFDPRKLATWRRKYAEALGQFPALNERLRDAATVAETFAEVAGNRAASIREAQAGALGRLMGVEDPADVARVVGGLFGRQDAVAQLSRLRSIVGNDPAARDGLRRATADFITQRLVSNTEAATSGRTVLKADQFQTFIQQNRAALRQVFNERELSTLGAIATDLQRANRSNAAVRIPGQSNTAQDITAVRAGDSPSSILMRIAAGAGGAGVLAGVGGNTLTGIAATVGSGLVLAMRQNGLNSVDDIVEDMLLNPARANMLLAKVPAKGAAQIERTLAQRYRTATAAMMGAQTILGEREDEDR